MAKKTRSVSREKLPAIAASLKAKAKTPNTLTLEAMVKELSKEIEEMLEAGYSYEDVAALFSDHGVEIAPSSIKSYHRKQKSAARNPKPEEQAQTSEAVQLPTQADDSPQKAEAPTGKTERKPKSDKPAKTESSQSGASTEAAFNVTNRDEL